MDIFQLIWRLVTPSRTGAIFTPIIGLLHVCYTNCSDNIHNSVRNSRVAITGQDGLVFALAKVFVTKIRNFQALKRICIIKTNATD